jgi:zinc transport system ATP-binding protein
MSNHAVKLDSVSFSYNGRPALRDVSFTIIQNEIVAIIGPNGSGKTSLLKLITGLARPDTGTVRVFGAAPRRVRGRIGYVSQSTLFDPAFPVTVFDVVCMGRLGGNIFGIPSRHDRESARAALAEVGMSEFERRGFTELSGGQRQRALIARGLATDPDLLLLDEPTSGIDQEATQRIYAVLRSLAQRMTVIFVSHDIGVVSSIATSVICVNREAVIHPTSELTGATIANLYQGDMSLVRHDHRCSDKGHEHE